MTTSKLTASLLAAASILLISSTSFAQYNKSAGRSSAPATMEEDYVVKDDRGRELRDEEGRKIVKKRTVKVKRDSYGNAQSSQFDLAVDGAFEGQTVVVLQLHQTTITEPWKALKTKGFSVYRMQGVPTVKQLEEALAKKNANQFWLIAGCTGQQLTDEHALAIKKFFDKGKGVYIWGDNDPCYDDANLVARALFDTGMSGNLPGDKTISLKMGKAKSGVLADHLISTGLEFIYEGITIATIDQNPLLTPFIWGSAGNVVASLYDKKGKRAILDGGFTRLYYKWDTAGTGRYIVNAAAWLANYERFGDEVVADNLATETKKKR